MPSRGRRDSKSFAPIPRKVYVTGLKGNLMPVRLKKLIGTIILIALVIVYALVATAVAVARLSEAGPLTHMLYFFLTGLLWVLPAMLIIKWMQTPPRSKA
jgi:hypothetical protein